MKPNSEDTHLSEEDFTLLTIAKLGKIINKCNYLANMDNNYAQKDMNVHNNGIL